MITGLHPVLKAAKLDFFRLISVSGSFKTIYWPIGGFFYINNLDTGLFFHELWPRQTLMEKLLISNLVWYFCSTMSLSLINKRAQITIYLQKANVVQYQTIDHRKHCKFTSIQQELTTHFYKNLYFKILFDVLSTKPNRIQILLWSKLTRLSFQHWRVTQVINK